MSNDFYVYTLSYPEEMGGAVFYVGKGTGNRIDFHEREARKGAYSHKCNTIRSIWRAGKQVIKRKEYENLSEEDALRYEARLIERYKSSVLTNEDRGCWSVLPQGEQPLSRKDMEAYQLTWHSDTGEIIRVEARQHYFWVHRKGEPKVQVFGISGVIDLLGKQNVSSEQAQALTGMQIRFRQTHSKAKNPTIKSAELPAMLVPLQKPDVDLLYDFFMQQGNPEPTRLELQDAVLFAVRQVYGREVEEGSMMA